MMTFRRHLVVPLIVGGCFFAFSCGDETPSAPADRPLPSGQAPAFSLTDVNPNSATHNAPVSPRDYLTQVSAWYFGDAT